MNKQLDESITKFLEQNKLKFIKDLQALIKFNSVLSDDAPDKPYGAQNAEALDYMMILCQDAGLECRNIDYYCMDATYGKGEEVVASLSHLDIVPVGDGWEHAPLDGEIEGDLIYGRGAIDDKGPSIAALYALKALLYANVSLKRSIRLIYGCDEESGMSDMTYYLKKCKAPDYAFSPDAYFPTIHAEKSVLHGTYKMQIAKNTIVKKITGGTRTNVVPDTVKAYITSFGSYHNDPDIIVQEKDGLYEITAKGVSAHASTPEEGSNAIMTLCKYLARILPKDDAYKEICDTLYNGFSTTNGMGLGIDCDDKPTGALTLNAGVIIGDDKEITLKFDIRHPVTLDADATYETLKTSLRDFSLSDYACSQGLYLPKDHPLIETLQSIYKDITGDKTHTFSIGGGTYARTLPCAVAFGPSFKGGKSKGAHQHDECASITELLSAARIYAHAIFELANI